MSKNHFAEPNKVFIFWYGGTPGTRYSGFRTKRETERECVDDEYCAIIISHEDVK